MVSFQRLHSHLKCLSNNDLKETPIEIRIQRALLQHLFGLRSRDFHGHNCSVNGSIQKQLDNVESQEIGYVAFKVLETQFQMFIKSRIYLEDEYVDMTRNKFLQYTRLDIPEFCDKLIQHMESVKKSIGEEHNINWSMKSRMKRLKRRNWKHITVSWQRFMKVLPAESSSIDTPLEQVQNHDESNVFANERRHSEQPESINDTYVLEKDDSNVIPDSSNICTNDNQSIQTIHMLAPKCATYNGRSTFANPKYLKKAQSEKPRLYEIPYDTSDPANRFCQWERDSAL
ncbi:hypothetical protein Tco_0690186 [Tanacetum coccineum]